MKKLIVALLASTAIVSPCFAADAVFTPEALEQYRNLCPDGSWAFYTPWHTTEEGFLVYSKTFFMCYQGEAPTFLTSEEPGSNRLVRKICNIECQKGLRDADESDAIRRQLEIRSRGRPDGGW